VQSPSEADSILGDDRVRVLFDGTLTDPQLDHPEGLAVHRDGSIWCGGERGQIYRLSSDASSLEEVASTGGFSLGMAFDLEDNLYVCDLRHAAVFRLDTRTGEIEPFTLGGRERRFRIPNYPAIDAAGRLYVSDSHAFREPGPGVFRIEADGSGKLWYEASVNFANGLALSPDGDFVYVAETFGHSVFRIRVMEDGSAGRREDVASVPGALPDGLAFDAAGNLYVGCYEPSQVLRISASGEVACLYRDPEAHTLCHPTNVAFRGTTLITTNLGRWHLTALDVGIEGLALPPARVDG
jgi:gluconolactonase